MTQHPNGAVKYSMEDANGAMTEPDQQANTCERCKWWAKVIPQGMTTIPEWQEWGECNSDIAVWQHLDITRRYGDESIEMHKNFGCRFWEQRAPKEAQSPCETEEKA